MSDFFTRLALRTIDFSSPAHTSTVSNTLAPTAAMPESPVEDLVAGESVSPESDVREVHAPHTGDVPPVPTASAPAVSQQEPALPRLRDAAPPASIEPARHAEPEDSLHEESVERETAKPSGARRESSAHTAPASAESDPVESAHASNDRLERPTPQAPIHPAPPAALATIEPASIHEPAPAPLEAPAPSSERIDRTIDVRSDSASRDAVQRDESIDARTHESESHEMRVEPLPTIAPASPLPEMPHESEEVINPAAPQGRASERDRRSESVGRSESTERAEPTRRTEEMRQSGADHAAPQPPGPMPRMRSFFRGLFPSQQEEQPPERRDDAARQEDRSSARDVSERAALEAKQDPSPPAMTFGTVHPFTAGAEPLDIASDDAETSSAPMRDGGSRSASSDGARASGATSKEERSTASDRKGSSADRSQPASRDRMPSSPKPFTAPHGDAPHADDAKRLDDRSRAERTKSLEAAQQPLPQGSIRPGAGQSNDLPTIEEGSETPQRSVKSSEPRRTSKASSSPSTTRSQSARPSGAEIAREIVKPLKAEAERLEVRLAAESASQARAERGGEAPRPASEASAPDVRPMSSHVVERPPESTPAARRESAPPPPAIRVSIGKVEVRAEPPPSAQTPRAAARPRGPAVSLSDYLKQRNRGH